MHAGSITNPETAAGRLYAFLSANPNRWWSGWDLTKTARTTAIGTRISEIRQQLPPGQVIEQSARPTEKHERGSWYRLTFGGQLDLLGVTQWAEGVRE